MSDTIREQVYVTLLGLLTTALEPLFPGIRVERNRDAPVTEFPSVIIIDGRQERVEPESTGFNQYQLTATVEGWVQAEKPDGLGPAANELYGQVLKALMADRRLGGLAIDTTEGSLDVEIGRREKEGPLAGFSVEFQVRFWTTEDDPYELGPGV